MHALESGSICIITQSHLCRNPRVLKEALTLSDAGYRITILNCTYDGTLSELDVKLIENKNIKLISVAKLEKASFATFMYRLSRKLATILVKKFGCQTSLALGYASWRYKTIALRQNADLYINHQEIGLYCGTQLFKAKKKVAFDFEDWYSEDLLSDARSYRPLRLLKRLEASALKSGIFCISPSDSMSDWLAKTYESRTPVTIYNTFNLEVNVLSNFKPFRDPLKLFWFSQTIGPGRGLEQFFEIINQVNSKVEIHLLGNISSHYRNLLKGMLNLPHQIHFHAVVSPEKLAEKIAEFDIGLALELSHPKNRDLTITNKYFQYLLSGLPVVATATIGQSEIFKKYGAGILLGDLNSPNSAEQLENWLQNKQELQKARERALEFAFEYCWEKESLKLINAVKTIEKL